MERQREQFLLQLVHNLSKACGLCLIVGLLFGLMVWAPMLFAPFLPIPLAALFYTQTTSSLIKKIRDIKDSAGIEWRHFELEYILLTEVLLGFLLTGSLGYLAVHWEEASTSLSFNYAVFVVIIVCYHQGEFAFVLLHHPDEVSWESFLIYHSLGYTAATLISQVEFFLERFFFPQTKLGLNIPFLLVFTPLAILGLVLRNLSFHQAKKNFHHLIRYGRDPQHRLVTTGVYGFDRHPSYLGYFLQAVSLQFVLKNPVCGFGFCVVLFKFFLDRIQVEEETLVTFFGGEYLQYRQRVPTRIPFLERALTTARNR